MQCIKDSPDTGDIKQKEDDLSLQSLEDIFILNLQKTLFVWFVAYSTQLIRKLEEEEMLFVSENDRKNNIYLYCIYIYGYIYIHSKYSSGISLVSAQHKLCLYVSIDLQHPHRSVLPILFSSASSLLTISKRSNAVSSLAQQLYSLNVEVSNRMALNSRENQAEILHLNFVSWYLHLNT